MWKTLIKGFLAGVMISIGGWLYLCASNMCGSVVAAFLFSIGLIVICSFGFFLYTGKICYLFSNNEEKMGIKLANLGLGLIGNLLGCLLIGPVLHLIFGSGKEAVFNTLSNMVNTKLSYPWYKMLVSSMFCGMMVFIAVEGYKRLEGFGKYFIIMLAIGGFIIMGFDHSIANMFYFFCNYTFSGKAFLYLLICVVGNSLGGLFMPLLFKVIKSE